MRIAVVGTGYVGLVTGTCFAEMGNTVTCVDNDAEKIRRLREGIIPIFEPGLDTMVRSNAKAGRLAFTTCLPDALETALFCFIAVGTPVSEDGSADLRYVMAAAREIGDSISGYKVIIDKSTVPVGTADLVRKAIEEGLARRGLSGLEFDVVSNPEFLKEGVAIEDFMRPDRVIVGAENAHAAELMKDLYEPFVRNQNPVLLMDVRSAELTKYAANAMLAARISFMNEMAGLCDAVGADINHIRIGIGTDRRIGMPFLYAGLGYGGSCFPKDVKELVVAGRRNRVEMEMMKAVDAVNERQKTYINTLIERKFGADLSGRLFGVWGLSFKPQTDDLRESPSLVLIGKLLARGALIRVHDPVAMEGAAKALRDAGDRVGYCEDMYDALKGVDALVLATEWKEFRQPDFDEMRRLMKSPVIFDGRNQYDPAALAGMGFEYFCVGRNVPRGR